MLKKLTNALNSENSFVKGFAFVAGGAALGHLIVISASPLVTRLYTPVDFGVLGLITSFVGLFVSIGSFRYEIAIVSADNDNDARSLLVLSIYLCALISVASIIVLVILRAHNLFGFEGIPWVCVPLVLVGVFLTAAYSAMRVALVRLNDYRIIGQVTLVQNIARAGGQILFGLFGAGGLGLVGGEIVCRFLGVIRSWKSLRQKMAFGWSDWRLDWRVLRKYKKFPLLAWPATFINSLGPVLQIPIFTSLYGIGFAGQLTLTLSVFGVAVALIGQSVAEVAHGKLAESKKHSNASMGSLLNKVVLLMALLAFSLTVLVWGVGAWAVAHIFGAQWGIAGEISKWVALYQFMSLLVFPVDRMIFVNEWHGVKLIFNSIFLVAVVFIPFVAKFSGFDALNAIALSSVVIACSYLLYVLVVMRKTHNYNFNPNEFNELVAVSD